MHSRNIFAGPYLDRAAHLRRDPAWFDAALADPQSRLAPVWNARSLITEGAAPAAAFIPVSVIPTERRAEDMVLLGTFQGRSVFAAGLEGIDAPRFEGARFEDLRSIASLLPAEDAGLLGYARAMILWRRQNRFCGTCGAPTVPAKGGHVLVCTDPACRRELFPRIDPAIIVLISDGERVLLGRQAAWPVGRYSTIAGFVEPGESLEDAVAREVFEETGVAVDQIEYHSSQPWPFPSSLMLGFTAHASTTQVDLRDHELEDARWFSRADFASGIPSVPPSISISFRLIEHWYDGAGSGRLRDLPTASMWASPR